MNFPLFTCSQEDQPDFSFFTSHCVSVFHILKSDKIACYYLTNMWCNHTNMHSIIFSKPVTRYVSLILHQVYAGNQVGVVLKLIVPAALGIKSPITVHYHGVFQGLHSAVTCSSFCFTLIYICVCIYWDFFTMVKLFLLFVMSLYIHIILFFSN